MDEEPKRRRHFLSSLSLPLISLLIASLSMASSISQSYNCHRNIESVQQNVLRAENLSSCREIIEVFFDFRLKAEEANGMTDGADPTAMRRELKSLVYRFGALGTFLANFIPQESRERYARLSWLLNDIASKAADQSNAEFDAKFAEADQAFATLNEDCAKCAQLVKI
ncbi:MAG: hypothetical protein IOC52_03510 [Methylobacterium sp.]|nr:hypothetical protein [Methylobacterium sp.]